MDTNELTSKQLIKRLFTQGTVPRIPFIPWIFTHAARLEQIPVSEMFNDPNQYARAIQNAQKLYGYDAIANVFDPSLEAEACGCPITWGNDYELPSVSAHPLSASNQIPEVDISEISKKGRLPVVLEATQRIKTVLGRTVAMVGVVTGPFALATRLIGVNIIEELDEHAEEAKRVLDFAGRVVVKVCQAYCELMPDIIALADDSLSHLPSRHHPQAFSVLGPVLNMVSFYNARLILVIKECYPSELETLFSFGADATVVPTTLDAENVKKAAVSHNRAIGGAIPIPILVGPLEQLRKHVNQYLTSVGRSKFFLSNEWEVPSNTPPENLHELRKIVSDFPHS